MARSIATAIGSGIFAFAIALMFAGIVSRLETSGEGVGAARAREGEGSARVRTEVKRILAVGPKKGCVYCRCQEKIFGSFAWVSYL